MRLRYLKLDDAPLMLEWMHDANVTEHLKGSFMSKRLKDAESFILAATKDEANNLHYAIASDEDEYMGTVSLKHIKNGTAEFAIAIRSCAMGKGYAGYAMKEIIEIGFDSVKLSGIYWCVSKNNTRAIRFYEKNGFCEKKVIPKNIVSYYCEKKDLYWFGIECDDRSNTIG